MLYHSSFDMRSLKGGTRQQLTDLKAFNELCHELEPFDAKSCSVGDLVVFIPNDPYYSMDLGFFRRNTIFRRILTLQDAEKIGAKPNSFTDYSSYPRNTLVLLEETNSMRRAPLEYTDVAHISKDVLRVIPKERYQDFYPYIFDTGILSDPFFFPTPMGILP